MNRKKSALALELTALLLFYILAFWYFMAQEKSTFLILTCFLFLFLVFVWSFCRSWAGWKEFGLDLKRPFLGWQWIAAPLSGWLAGTTIFIVRIGGLTDWPGLSTFFGFFIWGFFQECIFLGYCFRSMEYLVARKKAAIFLSAAVFSLIHWPNNELMAVTFVGGLYLAAYYNRFRNLIGAAFLHGLISLTLVTIVKPGGWIPNYRTGPEPLGPIRRIIQKKNGPDLQVGQFLPSRVPESLEQHFDVGFRNMARFDELDTFLKHKNPVFLVMSEIDFNRFRSEFPDAPAHIWHSSYILRRKFPEMKRRITDALIQLDFKAIEQMFRSHMVLISNSPPS